MKKGLRESELLEVSQGFLPFLPVLLLLSPTMVALGAGPQLDWARLIPNLCGTSGNAATEDSIGNIYVGSGPSAGLTKFDSAGNLLWTWSRQENDCAGHFWIKGISIDESTNVYLSGTVSGNVSIGDFRNIQPSTSAFFAKMLPDRTIVFAKFANNLSGENPLVKTSAGNFLIGGSFQDNPLTYEGITLSPTANGDVAILKLNPDGSPIWARRGSGSGYDGLNGMASNSGGDVFLAITTFLASSFGMGGVVVDSTSSKTLYLVNLDAAGNGRWIKSVASSFDPAVSNPQSSAVAYSERAGSAIWAGDFTGALNLTTPPISSVAGKDLFVAKITSTGTPSWAKTFGGTNDQFASAVAVDSNGNIYVAGVFFGQITIGQTTLTSRGKEDVFVAKLLEDGTVVWAKQIGYSGTDWVSALSFTKRGELLVVGFVEGGLLVDGVFLQTTGSSDGFIAKFKLELPPTFIAQPESKVVSAGMTITLRSEASSSLEPLSYQWWFNGAPLPGQTNSSLTLSNIQSRQGGSYFAVAENQAGTVQSEVAVVTYTDASTLVLSVHPSLQIFGTPGRTYRIEYATETRTPAQWTAITNLTLNTTPQLWVDQEAAVGAKRFYRVLLEPAP